MSEPPQLPAVRQSAERTLSQVLVLGRVSAVCLIVLAGISTVLNVRHPWSSGFLISLAVVGNGVIEWVALRRLAQRRQIPARIRVLAINQAALGAEIAAYSLYQAMVLQPEAVLRLLRRPEVAPFFESLPPDVAAEFATLLPEVIRLLYAVVGVVGLLGCLGMAWYYRSRGLRLAPLAAPAIPSPVP